MQTALLDEHCDRTARHRLKNRCHVFDGYGFGCDIIVFRSFHRDFNSTATMQIRPLAPQATVG
jgi:hypothetical protein